MDYYYVELDNFNKKDFSILSYGQSSNIHLALKNTKGLIKGITELEYYLLSACKGNILNGIYKLQELNTTLQKTKEEQLEFTT
jgi:hypothetical protein